MNAAIRTVVMSFALVSIAGCGGSGDGDGNKVVNFTKFSDIPDNGTTNFEGTSRSVSVSVDGAENVTTSSISGPDAATAALETENGEAVAIRINAPGANVSFDRKNGDTVGNDGRAFSKNGQDALVRIDDQGTGFEYQTFGVWLTGLGTNSGTVGVGSFGAKTASGSLPSSGTTATYDGASTGFVRDPDGTAYLTASEVRVSTDFIGVDIASTSTVAFDISSGDELPGKDLNFRGSGTVSGSGFTASVLTDEDGIPGSADGQFYGSNAQEVGGTFGLAGGGTTYIGSFGGKK